MRVILSSYSSTVVQVSDREWLATQPDTAARLTKAADMIQAGQGEDTCFRAHDIDGAAVTARRWQALAAESGDDDYFSSDLSDDQLKVRGCMFVMSFVQGGSCSA